VASPGAFVPLGSVVDATLRRLPDLALHERGRARVRLLSRRAVGASMSPDGHTLLVVNAAEGARLVSPAHPEGAIVPVGYASQSAWSPGGGHLAVAVEGGRVVVVSVPDGTVERGVRPATAPTFVSERELVVRRGCRLLSVDLAAPAAEPRPLGPDLCGNVVYLDVPHDLALIAEPGRYRFGTWQSYVAVRRVTVSTGEAIELLRRSDDEAVIDLQVPPRGERLCWQERGATGFDVVCAALPGGPPLRLVRDVVRGMTFDETGGKMLVTTGEHPHRPRDLQLVDLAAATIQKVVRTNREWWAFVPGGRRIVGHGDMHGADVYDLAEAWHVMVGRHGEEWEGVAVMPGDDSRLILGRESGASRDLYWVELEP